MAKLLILQNSANPRSGERLEARFREWGHTTVPLHCIAGQFPSSLDGYDGIVISGGPNSARDELAFIQREKELLREAAARGVPMLGICLGSQLLAAALCGSDQIFRRSSCEVGFLPLSLTAEMASDPLAPYEAAELSMFVWHNDDVRAVHPDIRVLAASPLCPNQIWRFRDQLVWGVQGHPEITRADAIAWFAEVRESLLRDGADLYTLNQTAHDAPIAKEILREFAKLCG